MRAAKRLRRRLPNRDFRSERRVWPPTHISTRLNDGLGHSDIPRSTAVYLRVMPRNTGLTTAGHASTPGRRGMISLSSTGFCTPVRNPHAKLQSGSLGDLAVDPLEILEVGELDRDLAAFGAHLDRDPGIEVAGQQLLELQESGGTQLRRRCQTGTVDRAGPGSRAGRRRFGDRQAPRRGGRLPRRCGPSSPPRR